MDHKTTFFQVQTVEDALKALFQHIAPLSNEETIATDHAEGRILAASLHSDTDLPTFPRSAMDGYAVRAQDTFGASQSLPAYLRVVGQIAMGQVPQMTLSIGEAASIHTGAMLPVGADAVVMVERTQAISDDEIEVLAPVAPGEHVVQIGEDVQKDTEILPAGQYLRPQDIGGLLALGIVTVPVRPTPRIALLGSGDELIPPEQKPEIGQIRDINSYTLAALFRQAGAQTLNAGIASDTLEDLLGRAQAALDNADMLVLSAGSSVSTRDLTAEVINRLGKPGIIQHGLAVKPGKPTIIATCNGKPVIGLPGNPVSAMLVARQLVLPIIRHLTGENRRIQGSIRAELSQNLASTSGRQDTVPVQLIDENGTLKAAPVLGKSNLIFTLITADGLIEVPLNSAGMKAGEIVDVWPF